MDESEGGFERYLSSLGAESVVFIRFNIKQTFDRKQ